MFDGWCNRLQNASSPDLVQFLDTVVPDEMNSRCLTWAIHTLGKRHYEPAVSALVRLLDFRRSRTQGEEIFWPGRELFPAEVALERIGKTALPEVVRAIEADATSETAREKAVAVWMEAYKYERPKGISLLREEEAKSTSNATKQRLKWAIQKALKYCGPPEQAACRQAASSGTS